MAYLKCFLLILLCDISLAQNHSEFKDLKYNENNTMCLDNSVEYILKFSDPNKLTYSELPSRIWIESNATTNAPLMILARQSKEMLSWQLPLEIEGETGEAIYNYTSRTMCHDILKHYRKQGRIKMNHENPIISVATSSNETIQFTINVQYETNFSLQLNQEYNFTITPSEPRYFFYNFTTNSTLLRQGDSNYETVILEVTSDDICMTVSIQNISCPVFDTNQDVTFRGFYETVNRKGGITIPKYKFPHGFYVVFVAKPDDYACTKAASFAGDSSYPNRLKHISLIIKPSITYSDYIRAVLLTLGCIGAFYIIFGLPYFVYTVKASVPRDMAYVQDSFSSTPSARIVRLEVKQNANDDGTEQLNALPKEDFQKCFKRWDKCIDSQARYFKRD